MLKANVQNATAGISMAQRSNWRRRERSLKQAEANNVKAQNDLVRYKQLVDKQEISQQQYDQAVAAAKASASDGGGTKGASCRRRAKASSSREPN